MTENTTQKNTTEPRFSIQRVYVKDLSLEVPNAPQIYLEQEVPSFDISIDVNGTKVEDDVYEASLTVVLTTKIQEKVAFIVEATQSGVFEVANIPSEDISPILGIMCPNILYPYLRANIADIVSRAGFPPIHLAEINFEAFYQQRLEDEAKNATLQ
jgi:preprotein translocase subunit SecB